MARRTIPEEGLGYGGPGKRLAVLVGCNYRGTVGELKGCINDVRSVQELLLHGYGFREEDVQVLVDGEGDDDRKSSSSSRVLLPTGANIRHALRRLASLARPRDSLFFHFSGHGTRLPASSTQQHHAQDDAYEECIVPCDMNLLTDEDFREIADMLPRGATFTMVCDSCHSGGLIKCEKEQIGDSFATWSEEEDKKNKNAAAAAATTTIDTDDHAPSARSLSPSTLLEILVQQQRKRIDLGDIRMSDIPSTLFDIFQDDASVKFKRLVRSPPNNIVAGHGEDSRLLPAPPSISLPQPNAAHAHQNEDCIRILPSPAPRNSSISFPQSTVASQHQTCIKILASAAPHHSSTSFPHPNTASLQQPIHLIIGGPSSIPSHQPNDPPYDGAILVSACQAYETARDFRPRDGDRGMAFGVMTHAICTVLSNADTRNISNYDLVVSTQKLLAEQGFCNQHPGLYCGDGNVHSPFILGKEA